MSSAPLSGREKRKAEKAAKAALKVQKDDAADSTEPIQAESSTQPAAAQTADVAPGKKPKKPKDEQVTDSSELLRADYFEIRERFDKKNGGVKKLWEKSQTDSRVHATRPSFNMPSDPKNRTTVLSNHFWVELPKVLLYEYKLSGSIVPGSFVREEKNTPKDADVLGGGTTSGKQKASEQVSSSTQQNDSKNFESLSRRHKRLLLDAFIKESRVLAAQRNHFATDEMSTIFAWKDLADTEYEKIAGDEVGILEELEIKIGTSEKVPKYALKLNLIKQVDMASLWNICAGNVSTLPYDSSTASEVPHALNIIISHSKKPANRSEIPSTFTIGSKKCYEVDTETKTGAGLSIFSGYFSTVKLAMGPPLLNLNKTTGAFYEDIKVLDWLQKYGNGWRKALKGVKVVVLYHEVDNEEERSRQHPCNTSHLKEKTIKGFGSKPLEDQTFVAEKDKNGNDVIVSVKQHLQDKHKIDTSAVDKIVCVDLGLVSKKDDHAWYPVNQLKILPWQPFRGTLPPEVISDMIKAARKNPNDSINDIKKGIKFLGLGGNGVERATPTVLNVRPEMIQLPFKQVPAPSVRYKEGSANVEHGAWNVKSQKLYRPGFLKSQVYVLFLRDSLAEGLTEAVKYGKSLLKEMNTYGINGCNPIPNITAKELDRTDLSAFEKTFQSLEMKPGSVVVYLNPKTGSAYAKHFAHFKQLADQAFGFHSLCLALDKIPKLESSALQVYMANVALKMNLKLGGLNHHVDIRNETLGGKDWMKNPKNMKELDVMIIGADVTHTGPQATPLTPSLAAVVGSVDASFGNFPGSLRSQTANQEVIEDFVDMVADRIRAWKEENKRLPGTIFYYRDGVDSGQYSKIREHEVNKIMTAFDKCRPAKDPLMGRAPAPKIVALVVAKRHHTRFYPNAPPGTELGSHGNCLPGTVVDVGVTDPVYFDFYLQSHDAIVGTAKPSHYFVLRNDLNMNAAKLQDLTYRLCHTYVRATRSVSYAPPAYYADRLCERGRCYIKKFLDGDFDAEKTDAEAELKAALALHKDSRNPWHPSLNKTMFWM